MNVFRSVCRIEIQSYVNCRFRKTCGHNAVEAAQSIVKDIAVKLHHAANHSVAHFTGVTGIENTGVNSFGVVEDAFCKVPCTL